VDGGGKMSSFNLYANNYHELLDQSVSISGESGAYFAEVKARYVASVLGPNFDGRLLDFGCGVGLVSRMLLKHLPAAYIDGYDPSDKSICAIDRELMTRGSFTWNRDTLRSDYNGIVVANVMHHITPEERQATIDFLASRLADGGRLFIFEHNPANPLTRWAVFRCPFDDDAVLLWPSEAKQIIANSGLQKSAPEYLLYFPHSLRSLRFLEKHLKWCPLGAQYVVVSKKTAVK
jgi:SAM-dependent methyltransferase